MKVLPDKNFFKKIAEKHNNGLLKETGFYSYNNFFLLFNNKLILRYFKRNIHQVIIHDDEKSFIKYKNTEFLCDKSYIEYKKLKTLQVPVNMNEIYIKQHVHKKNENSDVTLLIETFDNGIIRDIWFEIPDDLINNSMTLDVICSFLED